MKWTEMKMIISKKKLYQDESTYKLITLEVKKIKSFLTCGWTIVYHAMNQLSTEAGYTRFW